MASTAIPIRWAGRSSSPPRSSTPQTGWPGRSQQAGFTGVASYGIEGPGWPPRQDWADPQRREQVLFAARAVETQPADRFQPPSHRLGHETVRRPLTEPAGAC
jgi:hypothetical protein